MKLILITILFLVLSIDCYSDKFNSFIAIKTDLENVDNKTEIAIKDNIDVVGFATTAGSLALKNNFPTKDAFIIQKLKKNNFFCDNIDIKSIPENLNKYSEVNLIGRYSKIDRSKKIDINKSYQNGNKYKTLWI